MTDLDKIALELLAAELERSGASAEAVESLRHTDLVSPAIAVSTRAIRTALLTAPPGNVLVPVGTLERWQAAFAEEMAAHDIFPPIQHVKAGHDEIAAILAAAPEVK